MNSKFKQNEKLVHNEKRKRKYNPPKLTEYGKLAELTKGTGSVQGDQGGGGRKI